MFDPAVPTAGHGDTEDPYPSLSDFHDYEPNLEFDDTELEQATAATGKLSWVMCNFDERRILCAPVL